MALQNFKDIINNKAYFINSKDREIFEKGNLQSFFGFSNKDAIEFIVYDANDNQLPQGDWGLARYIPLTSENISDYFLIADGTMLQAYNFPTEYFIDVERLLQEAGYENGIFKTQVNLINHRVGSDGKFDKLWISEISPSRTEMRLFPLKRKETEGTELFERFNIFVKDGEFREDTIAAALSIIEDVKPIDVQKFLINKWGKNWVDKLKTEYKISSLEIFLEKVQSTFNQAAINEFTNKISDPSDLNFGKPKRTIPKLDLSKSYVKKICLELYIKALDFNLSKPVYQQSTQVELDTNSSVDIVSQVMKVKQSDAEILATDKIIGAREVIENRKRTENESKLLKLKKQKDFQLELPPPPPPTAPPAEQLPNGKTYYSYEITRMGIPASYAQSMFTYLDDSGTLQTIQTDQYGVVGTFCMEENSWKGAFGLYRFNQLIPCGQQNLQQDNLIKIDYTPKVLPNPIDIIVTPDGLPNINLRETVTTPEVSAPTPTPQRIGFGGGGGGSRVVERGFGMGFGNRDEQIAENQNIQIME
jgi:hypothetical protein